LRFPLLPPSIFSLPAITHSSHSSLTLTAVTAVIAVRGGVIASKLTAVVAGVAVLALLGGVSVRVAAQGENSLLVKSSE